MARARVRLKRDTLKFTVSDSKRKLGTALVTERGSEHFPVVRPFLSSGKLGKPVELSPTKTVTEAKKRIQEFFSKDR